MAKANPYDADSILRDLGEDLSDSERMERINGRVKDLYPGATSAEQSHIADDIWDEYRRRDGNRFQW